jgi:hypothetical protein
MPAISQLPRVNERQAFRFDHSDVSYGPPSTSAAGGLIRSCTTTSGDMLPRACTASFKFGAANTPLSTGLLVANAAQFRLRLLHGDGSVLWHSKSVPVTLTGP